LAGYLALGMGHILSGWDHLAFVLALLLLARSLGEVAQLVTGFTLAHSVTLALAVLGWVRPAEGAVEAVIAFSVALVAAENVWIVSRGDRRLLAGVVGGLLLLTALAVAGVGALPLLCLIGLTLFSLCHFALLSRVRRPARQRAALSFAFGLVHGFGFAGILSEMTLPTERLAPALFGFNVGVELGQLAVVAVVWPALRALARAEDPRWHRAVTEFGSAAICGLGVFWLVTRTFGAG
ncbi:MAG: HupE/UreJ family protein, partial [Myxococcota bacterium]